MRKWIFVLLFLGGFISLAYAQNTLTLSTYYSAPFASYDRIRLIPVDGTTVDCTNMNGLLILDSSDSKLKVCMGGALSGSLSPWSHDQTSDEVYLNDDDPDTDGMKSYVGIGTQTPADRLDLADHDGNIRIYSGNGTAHVLGDEGSGEADGIVLRTLADPGSGEPLFVVESGGFSQRLRVEHDGALKTSNYLEVDGTGNSYILGNLGVGGETAPVNQLDVDGAVVIGVNYAGTENASANGAPNGLLVEGKVCIGQTAPTTLPVALSGADAQLSVNGDMRVNNTINFDGGGSITDNGFMFSISH
jgi:hypothetical protein